DENTMNALRDMLKSGSGRSVLESQILQENSIARLLAIVRGEELPERPAPQEETDEETSESEAGSAAETASKASTEDETVAQEASAADDTAAGETATDEPSA